MKKIKLIAILLLSMQVKAQETYINMLDSNVIWNQVDVVGEGPTQTYYEYRTEGDTTIGNMEYYRLVRQNNNDIFTVGYIRQNDSGEVYFRITDQEVFNNICFVQAAGNPPTNTDLLLMDFGAQIGDTIHLPFEPTYAGDSVIFVYSIDSIEIAGTMRRIIYYSSGFIINGSWIEGIGSYMGLFAFWCFEGIGEWTQLTCYTNGEPIYGDCVVGIEEMNNDFELVLYPNPANETVNVTVAKNVNLSKVRVYELTGRVVIEKRMHENRMEMDLSGLSPGMYLVEVETKKGQREVKRILIN